MRLRREELEIVHLKGSGAGGQNRNRRLTGVRVTHLPTGVVAMATERRSQAQNLDAAMERLKEKLERLFKVPKKRVPTRRTKASKTKRLDAKRKRSTLKQSRRSDPFGE